MSVWYDDYAIIGTQEREWSAFNDAKDEFKDFELKKVGDCVSLGDFAAFASFLNHLIGDTTNANE